ncbi:MAG: hypothetical protein WAW86_08775 [Gammaproteobacteria bacterium]
MLKQSFNYLLTISCLMLSSFAFAAPPAGVGVGHGHVNNHGGFITTAPGNIPPGLNKHGKYPHGLIKKDKVPSGWNKGEKEGWKNKNHVIVPVVPVPVR